MNRELIKGIIAYELSKYHALNAYEASDIVESVLPVDSDIVFTHKDYIGWVHKSDQLIHDFLVGQASQATTRANNG